MTAEIYTRLQATATRLLNQFTQGMATYTSPPTTTGPSYDPVVTPGQSYAMNYFKAQGKELNRYIQGGFIQSSDLMVMIPKAPVGIDLAGSMEVEGVKYQIIMADPTTLDPSTPVVWRVGLRR